MGVENSRAPPPPDSNKRPTRRCIQKKLLFGVAPSEGGDTEVQECTKSDGEDKGTGKRKLKHMTTKKKASPGPKDSSGPSKASDFFTKVSVKRSQQKKGKDAVEVSDGSDDCHEAMQTPNGKTGCKKLKSCSVSSPCENITPSKLKGSHSKRMLATPKLKVPDPEIMESCQQVPDLWLEAKTAAEENQRLFAGKQIHPFFSCRKAKNRASYVLEMDNVQNKCLMVLNGFPPIHISDTEQDNSNPLDWSKWVFSEKSFLCPDSYHSFERLSLQMSEHFIAPLKLDDVSTIRNWHGRLSPFNSFLTSQLPDEVHVSKSINLSMRCNTSGGKLDELKGIQFQERVPCQRTFGNISNHNLWASKYHPEKASEVCGNNKAVGFLTEWLKSWQEKGFQACKNIAAGQKNITIDISDSSSQSVSLAQSDSDFDLEIEDEEIQLGNVLLVTGPVGCGKSAAIYACAKEKGFEVIEVNASDQRNGALVRQKFREATESHGLDICSGNGHLVRGKNHCLEFSPLPDKSRQENGFSDNDDDLMIVSQPCAQDSGNNMENRIAVCQITTKSLILFEDVDTIFDEDRGFIGAILQLAETSKRPIILTANCREPFLPQVLEKEVVEFILPSYDEILPCLTKICNAEGVLISSLLLKKLIILNQADIRKTIMQLQFWCQGKRDDLGSNKQRQHISYSPLELDLNAAYLVIPGVIPWGFSCKLSEKIALEISKVRDNFDKENMFVVNPVKQQEPMSMEAINCFSKDETVPITMTRNFMEKHRSTVNCDEYSSPVNDVEYLSNISESPLKFAPRSVQHGYSTVLSSESGDEHSDKLQTSEDQLNFNNFIFPDVSSVPVSQTIESESHLGLSVGIMSYSAEHGSQQHPHNTFENSVPSNIFSTCQPLDESCIPESYFVPSTENHAPRFLSTEVSSGHFVVESNENLVKNAKSLTSVHGLSDVDGDNSKPDIKICTHSRLQYASIFHEESVHGNEESLDIKSENAHILSRDCQLMDECSRADFGMGFLSKTTDNGCKKVRTVQETWERLRNCREYLKPLLDFDKKSVCQLLKCSYGMTNLISETDILLGDCDYLTYDHAETMSFQPDSVSWYDERMELASTFAQHGLCFFTNKSKLLGSELGNEKTVCLVQEMLTCSTSTMALGKVLSQESISSEKLSNENGTFRGAIDSDMSSLIVSVKENICNAILPIVPERLSMVIKGDAFHEYSSFLSQISKLENSRISAGISQQQGRRNRRPQHYLEACSFAMPSEDVTLLAQHCCFGGARVE